LRWIGGQNAPAGVFCRKRNRRMHYHTMNSKCEQQETVRLRFGKIVANAARSQSGIVAVSSETWRAPGPKIVEYFSPVLTTVFASM